METAGRDGPLREVERIRGIVRIGAVITGGRVKTPESEAWVARNLEEVVPDVRRLPMPLDAGLDHSNVYFVRDGSGWCIFDTGADSPATRDIWSSVLSGTLTEGVTRIIVSHHHCDHLGLAARLQEITGAPVYVRPEELATANAVKLSDPSEEAAARAFLGRNGMPAEDVDATVGVMKGYWACVIPRETRVPEHGQRMTIGRYEFEVMVTGGHSVAQVALYEPSLRMLLSGDQMLEGISSNIGLLPFGDAAPLANFFKSLDEIASRDIRLVLPGHHGCYRTDGRLPEKLRAHHRKRLAVFRERLGREMTAFELAVEVFGGFQDLDNRILALVETLAHLQWLEDDGSVVRKNGESAIWYQSVAP